MTYTGRSAAQTLEKLRWASYATALADLLFPFLYMFLTASRRDPAVNPSLFSSPRWHRRNGTQRPGYDHVLNNSVFQVVASTLVCLLLAFPRSSRSVWPFKKPGTNDTST
jgi:ABC-type Fe3+ transport system permease subunit